MKAKLKGVIFNNRFIPYEGHHSHELGLKGSGNSSWGISFHKVGKDYIWENGYKQGIPYFVSRNNFQCVNGEVTFNSLVSWVNDQESNAVWELENKVVPEFPEIGGLTQGLITICSIFNKGGIKDTLICLEYRDIDGYRFETFSADGKIKAIIQVEECSKNKIMYTKYSYNIELKDFNGNVIEGYPIIHHVQVNDLQE